LTVNATRPDLLATLRATLAEGRFLNRITERYPTVVLGADAATQLGVDQTNGNAQIYIDNQWFTVIGILNHLALAPELDRAALVGFPEAAHLTGTPLRPTTIYVRTNPDNVASVEGVLASAANPASPNTISVSRPSDLLNARTAATTTFTGLFLGLGALTLLVGGLGCANVMVIAVLERRTEIGIRRAVGATKTNIANQFLAESLVLSALGAIVGIAIGIAATTTWAHYRAWRTVIPTSAPITALGAAILVGLTAGLYPALQAARLPPTVALRPA
jgi:putative ABC transport system permease protein